MSQISRAAEAATKWWSVRLMRGDKAAFEVALRPLVETDLTDRGVCHLECDYDPQGHLLTAIRAAGVECAGLMFSAQGILPQKHELTVYPDCLEPKEGYGNWTGNIFIERQS